MTLPFLSGYAKDKDILENLYQVGIPLKIAKQGDAANQPSGNIQKINRKTPNFSKLIPKTIPLRFFLVITVILFYMGIVRIDSARRKKAAQREHLLRTGTLE
jgi:hypothetical protein